MKQSNAEIIVNVSKIEQFLLPLLRPAVKIQAWLQYW